MPALGARYGGDVTRLLDEMPSPEFEQWRILYDLGPWDETRSDLAAGQQIATAVAIAGGKPQPAQQYMPFLREAEKPQTEDEQRAIVGVIVKATEKGTRGEGSGVREEK